MSQQFDLSRDSCVTKQSVTFLQMVFQSSMWIGFQWQTGRTQTHKHTFTYSELSLSSSLSVSLSLSSLFFYLFLSTLFSFLSLFLCLYSLFFSLISVFHTHTLSFINITRFLVSERRRRLALKLVKKILALSERW